MRARVLPIRAIGAAIAMLAVVAPAPRAGAAPTTACNAKSGVTVIVDFTHFGRNIERGCAPGQPATALDALRTAGFVTAGTAQYGDAFVCRLDGLPSSAHEPCTNTPPANKSWSFYWARPRAADWTYSTTGVLGFRPAPGSIIAFAFGNYAKPSITPAAVFGPAPTTTTILTPAPAPTVAAATATTPITVPTSAPAATAPPTSATEPGPTVASAPARASTHASTSTTNDVPPIINRTIADTHDGSGSPRSALVALAIVAILAGAGSLTIRARRRRSP